MSHKPIPVFRLLPLKQCSLPLTLYYGCMCGNPLYPIYSQQWCLSLPPTLLLWKLHLFLLTDNFQPLSPKVFSSSAEELYLQDLPVLFPLPSSHASAVWGGTDGTDHPLPPESERPRSGHAVLPSISPAPQYWKEPEPFYPPDSAGMSTARPAF